MKIGITLSALTAVSFADCNGVHTESGIALFPMNACMVVDEYSTDYTCDGDDGYMNVYLNTDCSGDAAATFNISTVMGDEFEAVCDASSECSYVGNMSVQRSCDRGDSSSLLSYYNSDDCSGDALNSTSVEDVCLTCGAVAMTVKVVQVLAVVMWIAMA